MPAFVIRLCRRGSGPTTSSPGSPTTRRSRCCTSARPPSRDSAWPSSIPAPRVCTARRGGTIRAPARRLPRRSSRSRSGSPRAGTAGSRSEVGRGTAREVRALHDAHPLISLNVWAPVVNLLRDPRWGRNEEGYSEDPLLTARLATAFCRGLSGENEDGYLLTAPTLKHFLGYNNEEYRDLTSSALRPRVLHEYDLPPFREPIEAGAATGVMPSYNLVNGRPAHVSPLLRLIREWTDDELLTCSDAWAPSNLVRTEHYFDDYPAAHAAALRAGLDSFTDQDGDGTLTTAAVTQAVHARPDHHGRRRPRRPPQAADQDPPRRVRRGRRPVRRGGRHGHARAPRTSPPRRAKLRCPAAERRGPAPVGRPAADRGARPARGHPLRGLVQPRAPLPGHDRRRHRRDWFARVRRTTRRRGSARISATSTSSSGETTSSRCAKAAST